MENVEFKAAKALVEQVGGEVVLGAKRGRPVNPESNRQKALAELEERRAKGLVKRGRPKGTVNPNSKRQQRIAEMAAKKVRGEGKPGRPKVNKEEVEVVVENKG